jgi:hypothetical protein
MFNVYSIENQNFYLNNSLISGIQDLDISYNNNIQSSLTIDDNNQNYFISAPVVANLNLIYLLSSNDNFINYTGNTSFSGKVEYGDKYFTFSSGYLNSYSLNYRLGAYPVVNIASLVLGELANTSGTFSYQPKLLNNFNIGDPCYVDLNLNEADNNRLQSFNLNIDVPREPVYTIGNYLPDDVIIKYPISVNLDFEFSVSNYNQEKITNIFNNLTQRNLSLSFKKYNTSESLLNLNLSNLINPQTQLKYNINDDAILTLNLSTFILSGA